MSEMMSRELTYVVARNRDLPVSLTARLSSLPRSSQEPGDVAIRGWSSSPPARSSYLGEGVFGCGRHGLLLIRTPLERRAHEAYEKLPSEAKGYFRLAGEGLRQLLSLFGTAGEVAETLAVEGGIDPRDAVETIVPFVDIVEVGSAAHADKRGSVGHAVVMVQDHPASGRRTLTIAGLGPEAPGLIMRARLDREVDYLRARARTETVDLRLIQGPLLESVQTGYYSELHQAIKEALRAVRDRLAAHGYGPSQDAAAVLRYLTPLLPSYRRIPECAELIASLEAAAEGRDFPSAPPAPARPETSGLVWPDTVSEAMSLFLLDIERASEEGAVFAVACAPDGRRAIRAGGARTEVPPGSPSIWLWDLDTGRALLRLVGHGKIIRSLAFFPDGRRAVSGGDDGTIIVWDVHNACVGRRLLGVARNGGSVTCVAVSPEAHRVVSVSELAALRIWDVETGREVGRVPFRATGRGTMGFRCAAWLPDGRRILTGRQDGAVAVWDLETRRQLPMKERHAGGITTVAVSSDGRWGLSGGTDHVMRLWDIETRQEAGRFEAPVATGRLVEAMPVAFTRDGRSVLAGCADGAIRVWDIETGRESTRREAYPGEILCFAATPDGRRIICGGGAHVPIAVCDL